jgi:LysR family transcriptional regulator, glycine cleavage system transcriptional activator
MASTSHLRSLQALDLAVRTGSLKKAAQALSISPAAAGQRVKALEDYLGIDLLVRGRSGLKPTPALAATMDKLTAAFRDLAAVADALDMQRKQEIHIAAASDFAELWLAPRLAKFRAAHPNVLFCINGEGETPLRLGPVDCEITFASRSNAPNCDVLFRDFLVPISSMENTRRIAKLKKRERLEGFPLLHLDFYKEDPAALSWPSWIKANKLRRTARHALSASHRDTRGRAGGCGPSHLRTRIDLRADRQTPHLAAVSDRYRKMESTCVSGAVSADCTCATSSAAIQKLVDRGVPSHKCVVEVQG